MYRKKNILLFCFVFAIPIAIFFSLCALVDYRQKYYYFDVSADQVHGLRKAMTTEVAIEDNLVRLEGKSLRNASSFLRVCLNASALSYIFQPCIDIESEGLSEEQCFAYGASGCRYLNITNFTSDSDRNISLKPKNIDVTQGSGTLYQYENISFDQKRVLILASHPDDAEIAGFGLYSSLLNPLVVTVTAGDSGGYMYDELFSDAGRHYIEKGKIRTLNSLVVPAFGNVPWGNAINLGYFDGTLEEMFEAKKESVKSRYTDLYNVRVYRDINISNWLLASSYENSWTSLVSALVLVIDQYEPHMIVTPHPWLDTNSDHVFTSLALFDALKESKSGVEKLLFYSNHFRYSEYFPYGDAGGVLSLPPNFDTAITYDFIFSFPLDKQLQARKTLALDSMNDLRQDTEWITVKGSAKQLAKNVIENCSDREWSYFRRAVRSNELFLGIELSNFSRFENELLRLSSGRSAPDNDANL